MTMLRIRKLKLLMPFIVAAISLMFLIAVVAAMFVYLDNYEIERQDAELKEIHDRGGMYPKHLLLNDCSNCHNMPIEVNQTAMPCEHCHPWSEKPGIPKA